MFETVTLKGITIRPALFLAPMAGITHSAFRRLVADFGGYGALFTEMLSGSAVLRENLALSPFTKRRECEKSVIYQLLLNGEEDIPAIIAKLRAVMPFGIDLNLGCPAPKIRTRSAGISLFHDAPRLDNTLATLRRNWDGILTVKCRLGNDPKRWHEVFQENIKIFGRHGVDAITIHPRFSKDKLKRRARWEFFPLIADLTDIPIIGNGDIISFAPLAEKPQFFISLKGLMLGRIAVVKPWIFTEFFRPLSSGQSKTTIDYAEIWDRFYRYTVEDFPPEKAIGRIKEFTSYYARNFFFGHELYRTVQGADDLRSLYANAQAFLSANPRICREISVAGI